MSKQWTSPNTIIGDAATGSRYLRREHINENFWREIKKGNHILFVAPRRVGKTSIMQDLADNPEPGFICIYQNIEGVKSKNEFYKRLFDLVLQCTDRSKKDKIVDVVSRWVKRYEIDDISKSGVKIKSKELDYESELRNMIPELAESGHHTIIFLDEFAEVINKLKKQNRAEDAIDILHTLRELRSDADFCKFTLVYAGSVGLQFVIKSIDRPKLINDLHPIETGALTESEAAQLVNQLVVGATMQMDAEIIGYLMQKINHLLPYYIQLMIQEADMIGKEQNNPQISHAIIDAAFDRVLKKNKNFEDWLSRLKDYQPIHFPFINHLLITCAHNDKITIQEVYNIACDAKHNYKDDYMDFVEELMNDGYFIESPKHVYRFISPFLQQFWLNKFPIKND